MPSLLGISSSDRRVAALTPVAMRTAGVGGQGHDGNRNVAPDPALPRRPFLWCRMKRYQNDAF
jgi:hypothetical protein